MGAVCINQRDISEKNAQVRMMPRIYAGAELVLALLGEWMERMHVCL